MSAVGGTKDDGLGRGGTAGWTVGSVWFKRFAGVGCSFSRLIAGRVDGIRLIGRRTMRD